MILPKGTVEFQRSGGEDAIKGVMGRIKTGTLTGYMLILGKVENSDGDQEDVTGQLVFKEGEAVLCESVVNNESHKGLDGVYPLLKSMLLKESTIEFKSKIDVEPPIAFFKECKVDNTALDIEKFMDNVKTEEEERQRLEEENKWREERRIEIRKEAEKWLTSGYLISSFPEIMDKKFEKIEDWHKDLSEKIGRIKGYLKWLMEIEEVEMDKEREELIELMKKPEEMMAIESAKTKFQESLDGIMEKRQEIQKWVNLWKDEGYNTLNIEENMKDDLNTAWNAMTEFMDHIQQLKDSREELENIKQMDEARGLGSEIREIDFLLNDPDELDNINRMIEDLKRTIEEEKEAKTEIMTMAKEIESQGFDISSLKEAFGDRLNDLRESFNLLMNNTMRITEIREELNGVDRRDIPSKIDEFIEDTKDPMKLDEYEEKLIKFKDMLDGFKQARKEISDELKSLKGEGFLVNDVEEKMDSPVKQLKAFMKELNSKITELRGLRDGLSNMDRRWMENEFQEVEGSLGDPSKIEWIRESIGKIQEKIDIHEKQREQIKEEMGRWGSQGFIVTKLMDVIEGKPENLTSVHKEISKRIEGAKKVLSSIANLDVTHFQRRVNDLKDMLKDPYELEPAKESFEELSNNIGTDHEMRSVLRGRIEELKGDNWSFEGIEDIIEEMPEKLQVRIDDMESRVTRLTDAFKDIENWDPLEMKWLSSNIDELKEHIHRIADADGALDHFTDMKNKVLSNKERRQNMKNTLAQWKDVGYIIRAAFKLQDDDVEKFSLSFEDLKERIGSLESIQNDFDSLNTKQFPKEAEDIEFKLNDPGLLDEINASMADLKKKIAVDQKKRDEFRDRIEDYTDQGFMGAEKLKEFLDEDISIVDLEFKNFAKEVDLFRKYMEKVGFVFKVKEENKTEE